MIKFHLLAMLVFQKGIFNILKIQSKDMQVSKRPLNFILKETTD